MAAILLVAIATLSLRSRGCHTCDDQASLTSYYNCRLHQWNLTYFSRISTQTPVMLSNFILTISEEKNKPPSCYMDISFAKIKNDKSYHRLHL